MLKTYSLKNGLNIATYSIPEMRSIYLSEVVKAGSIFDSEKNCGVAHFMEHLLVQGIPSLPNVEVFSNFIEGLAGSYGATTGPEDIEFHMSFPSKQLDDCLKIAFEVFFEPLFPKEAIERERQAVFEEIRDRQSSSNFKLLKFFMLNRFKRDFPFLYRNGGTIETVQILTRKDLIDYYQKFFLPKNTYLVVVGGFENDHIKKQIEEIYSKVSSSKKFIGYPNITNKDLTEKKVSIRNDSELKLCYLDLTFPSIPFESDWKVRMNQVLVSNILGNLRGSRLFQLLRYKKGLVYYVGTRAVGYEKTGYFGISSEVSLEKLDEVLSLIIQELKVFYTNGVTQKELEYAKNFLINRALMSFDNPSAIAGWIKNDFIWKDRIYLPEEYIKYIEAIDQKTIMDFMKEYWDFSKLNLSLQGPIEDSKQNINKFTKMMEVLDG